MEKYALSAILKESSEFHKAKNTKDGFYTKCKICKNFAENLRYQRPEVKKQQSEYSKLYHNRPDIKERTRINKIIYTKENIEKLLIKGRECYQKQRTINIEERLLKGAQPGDIILYILKFTYIELKYIFYKIGVTSLSIKERYKKYKDYTYEIVYEYYFEEDYCYALEQKLIYDHRSLGLQHVFPENEKFVGYTECFTELNEDVINKYLK